MPIPGLEPDLVDGLRRVFVLLLAPPGEDAAQILVAARHHIVIQLSPPSHETPHARPTTQSQAHVFQAKKNFNLKPFETYETAYNFLQ